MAVKANDALVDVVDALGPSLIDVPGGVVSVGGGSVGGSVGGGVVLAPGP